MFRTEMLIFKPEESFDGLTSDRHTDYLLGNITRKSCEALQLDKNPTSTRTRMRRDDRRKAILSETITALSETGFHGLSLNELSKKCGLTNAGLLHHFGSKENLLIALLQERDRLDEEAVSAALGSDIDREHNSLEQCVRSFRAIVARNADQPELIRLYAILRAEALVPDHPAFAYFRAREMGVIEIFTTMLSGIVPDPVSTARQIVVLMHGLEMQWLRESRIFDLVEEWEKAARKILSPAE